MARVETDLVAEIDTSNNVTAAYLFGPRKTTPANLLAWEATATATVLSTNDTSIMDIGTGAQVSAPSTGPTLTDNAAGSMAAGTYQYAYLEQHYGATSFSPITSITIGASRKVMVELPSIRKGATNRMLYRTKAGGATFYLLYDFGGDLGYHQNKYLDNTVDSSLTQTIQGNGTLNTTSARTLQVIKGVKYLRTNPDDAPLVGDHSDLTLLTSNGDDLTLALDCYSGMYTRTRSKTNLPMAKIGQVGTNSAFLDAISVSDDGGPTVATSVFKVIDAGWIKAGASSINPATLLDLVDIVTAKTSFTGTGLMQGLLRGASGDGNYAGLDFKVGVSNSFPEGRVGVIHTANGSFMQFGTSATYSSGITNGLVAIDYNGRLGVGLGVATAYTAYLNTKSDGSGTPLMRNIDSSGYVRHEVSEAGSSKWYITGEASPLNYSRGSAGIVGGYFELKTEIAGSGPVGNVRVSAAAGGLVVFGTNGSDKWYISTTGQLLPLSTHNVGASGGGIGELFMSASTTARAHINFAAGVAPTSPVNGDFWFDGTSFFGRIAGVTKTFTVA